MRSSGFNTPVRFFGSHFEACWGFVAYWIYLAFLQGETETHLLQPLIQRGGRNRINDLRRRAKAWQSRLVSEANPAFNPVQQWEQREGPMHQHVSDERYTHTGAKGGPKRSRVRPERSIAIEVPPHDNPARSPKTMCINCGRVRLTNNDPHR